MNKEIKFRAWDKGNKVMLTWDDFFYKFSETPEDIYGSLDGTHNHLMELMQYTGLKDKNGVEIYEGDLVIITERENIGTFNVPDDIIANNGYTGREDIYQGEVKYQGCAFGIDDKDYGFIYLEWDKDYGSAEVIGNIYENPDLLKPLTNK